MDEATRTAIEKRIAELQAQRTRLVMNVAAIDGAVAELQRWLAATPASCECGGGCQCGTVTEGISAQTVSE